MASSPVQVSIDPALTWMSPLLELCARGQSGFDMVAQSDANPNLTDMDFEFNVNEVSNPQAQAIILGTEKILFIVNNSNPNNSINTEGLAAILEGKISIWQDGTPLQLYVYPPQSAMMASVSKHFQLQNGFSLTSLIYFFPQDILQKIREDPSGFGFIPANLLNDSVKPVSLDPPGLPDPEFQIIVEFDHELSKTENAWLACIEKGLETN